MSIVLDGLTKRFEAFTAIADFALEVADGELLVLLGPSGSGKSTVLRLVAGLVHLDAGRVVLQGIDATHLPPQQRDIGFVFQSYALFRHMTVAENVAFPLRVRGVPRRERERRVEELLMMVGLVGYGRRLPRQLSGGQQQRVALARAIAHRPRVLLLDEPFGALDARTRAELRRSLKALQRELHLTTIFVTHDRDEAFEIGDRVAVMAAGRLVEVGPPPELYVRPQTELVATMLGATNLIVGESTPTGVRIGPVEIPLGPRAAPQAAGRRVQVLFRPEDVFLGLPGQPAPCATLGEALVESSTFVGPVESLRLRLPKFVGVRAIAPTAPFGADHLLVEASRPAHEAQRLPLAAGARATVGVRRIHVLPHPGFHFLACLDGNGLDAVRAGVDLARRAHARLTLLALGAGRDALAEARALAAGVTHVSALTHQGPLDEALAVPSLPPFDLLLLSGERAHRLDVGQRGLQRGSHHVMLVAEGGRLPERVLLCAAAGEPGKRDVAFTARLVRHLGAPVTVLTVLDSRAVEGDDATAARFLEGSVRTLEHMGLRAVSVVRRGHPESEIALAADGHDLLVLGAPLRGSRGDVRLDGIVSRMLRGMGDRSILIVRAEGGA